MSNFTQPVCRPCWDFAYTLRGEIREPVQVTNHEVATCCNCGSATRDGIFFRFAEPLRLRYPTIKPRNPLPPPPPEPGPPEAPRPPRDRTVE